MHELYIQTMEQEIDLGTIPSNINYSGIKIKVKVKVETNKEK